MYDIFFGAFNVVLWIKTKIGSGLHIIAFLRIMMHVENNIFLGLFSLPHMLLFLCDLF